MAFSRLPFDPPARSSFMLERLNEIQARRLAAEQDRLRVLQATPRPRLSPSEMRLEAQYRKFMEGASQRLAAAHQAAERRFRSTKADEDARRGRLFPAGESSGFYRSSKDRNAAMLGILQRERRISAPLTREAFNRAKAIAASRSYGYSPSSSDFSGFPVEDDPCVELELRERNRRETMFAFGFAGRPYYGSGRKKRRC